MDGAILKYYIENQKKSKVQIAKELGMTKQNLYQLFESENFNPATIANLEKVLKIRWDKVKESVNIDISHGILPVKVKNAPVRPQEAHHAPDYRDEMIAFLKKEISSNEAKMLLLLQRNQAILGAIVETLPKLVSKLEKTKLLEAHEEMNKRIEHHLDALKKENI